MRKMRSVDGWAAVALSSATGLGFLIDAWHILTFHGRGSPDVAALLILVVIAALHFGLTGANVAWVFALRGRPLSRLRRVTFWSWFVACALGTSVLSLFSLMLST